MKSLSIFYFLNKIHTMFLPFKTTNELKNKINYLIISEVHERNSITDIFSF